MTLPLFDQRLLVTVDNRIRFRIGALPQDLIDELRAAFTHANPVRSKMESLGLSAFAMRREPKTIVTWTLRGDEFTVPRGGLGRVRAVLDAAGVARRVVDQRVTGDPTLAGRIPAHAMVRDGVLYDFQREIVDAVAEVENCFVRAPTGGGKSAAALALASTLNLPTLIVVHNGGLMRQWIANARDPRQLGLAKDDVGVIGGGTFRVRPVTIAMQQTLRQPAVLARVRDVFGVFIADELQTAASATFLATYDAIPARYRIGMSANERRRDRKEFLIYDLFGDCVVDVDQDELIDRGVVHDVEVRVVRTDFDPQWYTDLKRRIREAADRDDMTSSEQRALSRERIEAFDRLLAEMMIDERRQATIAAIVQHEVANCGEQVLILSHRREHCARNDADVARRGVVCGRMVGGDEDRDEFERSLAGLRAGMLRAVAGTYQAIGTGIDLPSVAVGVCTTPIANSKDGKPFYQQVRGRLCRRAEGKEGARIWYVWDERVFGKEPLRNLTRWNNSVHVLGDDGAWHDGKAWLKREA